MSSMTLSVPRIVTVEYHQDDHDTDYGCCLWARFYFDLDNYSLTIESDCGSYGYSWCKTPQVETFLHLCNRFDWGYLLDKLARQNIFDGDETWDNLKWILDSMGIEDDLALFAQSDYDVVEELQNLCRQCTSDREWVDAIEHEIKYTPLDGALEYHDIWSCVSHTYPINAKTISKIFVNEIMPWLSQQPELIEEFKKIERTPEN